MWDLQEALDGLGTNMRSQRVDGQIELVLSSTIDCICVNDSVTST